MSLKSKKLFYNELCSKKDVKCLQLKSGSIEIFMLCFLLFMYYLEKTNHSLNLLGCQTCSKKVSFDRTRDLGTSKEGDNQMKEWYN